MRETALVKVTNAQTDLECLLENVAPSVQRSMTVWGHTFDIDKEILPYVRCGCGRPAECPGINLSNLQHLCFNMRDFSGNVHMDKNEGVPWIEFHGNVCFSIFNHIQTFDAFRFGLSMKEFQDTLRKMSTQEQANGGEWMNSGLFKKHISFKVSSKEIQALNSPEVQEEFAHLNGLTLEEARDSFREIIAWYAMMKIVGRTITSLNHELVDSFDSQSMGMIRLWGDESFERMENLVELAGANVFSCLPLVKEGKPFALQCGNNKSIFEYLDRKMLPSPTNEPGNFLPEAPKYLGGLDGQTEEN